MSLSADDFLSIAQASAAQAQAAMLAAVAQANSAAASSVSAAASAALAVRAGTRFQADNLIVTAPNMLSGLSQIFNGQLAIIVVNGQTFTTADATPAFTLNGTGPPQWISPDVALTPGRTAVSILYSVTLAP